MLVISAVSYAAFRWRSLITDGVQPVETSQQSDDAETDASTLTKGVLLRVLREIRLHAIAVACVFIVTLSLFPSVTASVRSSKSGYWSTEQGQTVFVLAHFLLLPQANGNS